jgi:hypothetical protein
MRLGHQLVLALSVLALPFGASAQSGDGMPVAVMDTTFRQFAGNGVHIPQHDPSYTATSSLAAGLAAGVQTSLGVGTAGVFFNFTLTSSLAGLPYIQRPAVSVYRGSGSTTCATVEFTGISWDGRPYNEIQRNVAFASSGNFALSSQALKTLTRVAVRGCTPGSTSQQLRVFNTDWYGLPFKIQNIGDLEVVCRRRLGGTAFIAGGRPKVCINHTVNPNGTSQWQFPPRLIGNAIQIQPGSFMGPAGGYQFGLTENDEVWLDFIASRATR